jgi:hypothetical protein
MTVMRVERDKISAKLLACVGAKVLDKDKTHAGIHGKWVKQLLESVQPTCRGTDADNWERRLAGFFGRHGRSLPRRQYGSADEMLSLLQALHLLQISDLRHGSSVVPGIRADTAPAIRHGSSCGLRFGLRSERSHVEPPGQTVLESREL